jgi:hypothetical protein
MDGFGVSVNLFADCKDSDKQANEFSYQIELKVRRRLYGGVRLVVNIHKCFCLR